MEIRHLHSFCIIAEEQHVTRAAARLHLAQPALTQQVRALEREFGTPLLRKCGRGIELTEAGRWFHQEASAILEKTRAAALRTSEVGRGIRGNVIVGMTEAAGFAQPVSLLIGRYKKRYPDVLLSFLQADSAELLVALESHQIDAAIVCPPVPGPQRFESFPYFQESCLVAIPKRHPLARKATISVKSLRNTALIFHNDRSERHDFASTFREACMAKGFTPRVVQETPDLVLALNLVAAGIGITFIPKSLCVSRSDKVVYRTLRSNPPFLHSLSFVTRCDETKETVKKLATLALESSSGKPALSEGTGVID